MFKTNCLSVTCPQYDVIHALTEGKGSAAEGLHALCKLLRKIHPNEVYFVVAASENHKKTEGVHVHASVRFTKRIVIKVDDYDEVFGKHPHLEGCRAWKNWTGYCCKDGSYYNDGCAVLEDCINTYQKRNKRKVSDVVGEAIRDGSSVEDMAREYPGYCAPRWNCLKKFHADMSRKKPEYKSRDIVLLCGLPGAGKTRAAREVEDLYIVPIMNKTMWFDRYDGESAVLLDDFAGHVRVDSLLRILHEYSESVEFKGGHVDFNPDLIILTSSAVPRDWYDWSNREDKYQALLRRIKHLIWIGPGCPGGYLGDYAEKLSWTEVADFEGCRQYLKK